jgi:ABC-type uncharacterized transport system permease subunit
MTSDCGARIADCAALSAALSAALFAATSAHFAQRNPHADL